MWHGDDLVKLTIFPTMAAGLILAGAVSAAEYQAATITGGATFTTAASYSVGWRFIATEDMVVTAIGIIDADGGGLSGNHTVRLYDVTHAGVLATVSIPAATPAESAGDYNAHFVSITPFALQAGTTYCVAKNKGTDNYRYDSSLVSGPGIAWKDGVGSTNDLPPTAAGFSIIRTNRFAYFGPTFKYGRSETNKTALSVSGGIVNGAGAAYSVGWRFHVDRDVTVRALGITDVNNNGITGTLAVRLYDVTHTATLATASIPSTTPSEGVGSYMAHFVSITPIMLTTGTTYLVANNRGTENYLYDASITPATGVIWQDGVGVSNDLPANASGFNIVRATPSSYFGPNFKFTAEYDALDPLSTPITRAVYQRGSNNVARIPISGFCSSGLDAIEARAVVRPGYHGSNTGWVAIDSSPGSAYSNDLVVAGGWYDIEVRAIRGGVGVFTTRVERVGVGENFITCGQSNSASHGAPAQTPVDDRINVLNLNTGVWQKDADPQPYASGAGGSAWPDFGDLLALRADVPVGIVPVGQGSTTVANWVPGTGAHYAKIALAISSLKPYGGFRSILWHQGESDSIAGTAAATYASRLNSIITQSRADAGFAVPWGVALASYHPDVAATASNQAKVIAGQWLVITNTPGVFKGAATDSFHTNGWLADAVHFNDVGLRDHGRQWVDAVWNSVLTGDRDHDGVPDLWMLMYFGHADGRVADKSRATDDADGDGVGNLDEYKATTDPLDPALALRVTDLTVSNGLTRVVWPTVAGRKYQVEWTAAFTNQSWEGNGPLSTVYSNISAFDDTSTLSVTTRFYRVGVAQ